MLNTLRTDSIRAAAIKASLAAFLLAGSRVAPAADIHLCAMTGTATFPAAPSAISVPVWGYALGDANGTCPAAGSLTMPGGPVVTVAASDTIILHNGLPEATGLLFQGQAMIPDTAGVAPTETKTYTFTATIPGTYLYQAAPLPKAEHQVARGLYGALVVRPAAIPPRSDSGTVVTSGSAVVTDGAILATDIGSSVSGTGIPPGTAITAVTAGVSFTMSATATAAGDGTVVVSRVSAYDDPATAYNDEAVLVLSEIDPALNGSAIPNTFDMRNFAPKYFLINGKAYPGTDPIPAAAGHKLLLRYVNAGAKHHSMGALGLRQNFIAKDGSLLPTAAVGLTAETLAAGQTGDALIGVPQVLTASSFAIYDASLNLHNSNAAGFGGMLTFVNAGTGSAATGPTTNAVALAPNPTNGSVNVVLTASVAGNGANVTAAEYFIDAPGAAGSGMVMTGTFGGPNAAVSATLMATLLATIPSGIHTIYVHGSTATSWGTFSSASLNLDKAGPTTSSLTLTPNPSNGSVNVALSVTASDSASGGSNVTAAEYTVDGGAAIAMTLGGAAAPVRSATAAIPQPIAAGNHIVAVRSQDALGNWGAPTNITLTVLAAGPTTSDVSAAPNPNNGVRPLSSSQPVVRLTATMTATGSTVSGAEAFIDTVSASGTGFPLVPSDGLWDGATENGRADIPLGTINALSTGTHTIYVRGKNALGTWGATATGSLLIDHNAPTISGAALTPSTILFGAASVTMSFTPTDTGGSGLTGGGQYWIDGSATPPANPTAFTGTSVTINTGSLAAGTHTVYVRVQDAATNWSAVSSATLSVVLAVNDARTITANTSATQTSDTNTGQRVLANDQPLSNAARTAALASAPIRTGGTGAGTITVTCPGSLGTAATPAISGNTVCTNGAYRVTLNGVGTNNATRQASKRGAYQFTYTEILNGVSSTATVTITVN